MPRDFSSRPAGDALRLCACGELVDEAQKHLDEGDQHLDVSLSLGLDLERPVCAARLAPLMKRARALPVRCQGSATPFTVMSSKLRRRGSRLQPRAEECIRVRGTA